MPRTKLVRSSHDGQSQVSVVSTSMLQMKRQTVALALVQGNLQSSTYLGYSVPVHWANGELH